MTEVGQISTLVPFFEQEIRIAFRAFPGNRLIPCCKIAFRIVAATPERFASLGTSLDNISAVSGTFYSYGKGLCVLAFRIA